ncbi:hypothetical protein M9H77_16725 [Catharanthus roseus]|uniref:Uncharacterized protein n=2 Tax=Catharanthus roseus TaxID=4058 RepID=A0ACC0B2K7_CATRO|nr:hypothetical protein M9H77_16724 [Catharanthus roseus]KAI5666872.1 hypothetical protein M9H77_16725 [Catharanthus roseus]
MKNLYRGFCSFNTSTENLWQSKPHKPNTERATWSLPLLIFKTFKLVLQGIFHRNQEKPIRKPMEIRKKKERTRTRKGRRAAYEGEVGKNKKRKGNPVEKRKRGRLAGLE